MNIEEISSNESDHEREPSNLSLSANLALVREYPSPNQFSHQPIVCPLDGCKAKISASEIFRHFVHEHERHTPYRIHNIAREDYELHLQFKLTKLKFSSVRCLAFLIYGSRQHGILPAQRGLCLPNDQLMPTWRHHQYHLAVLLLVCRKTFYTFRGDKEEEARLQNTANSPEDELYFVWLAGAETSKPLQVMLQLYNKRRTMSRCTQMNVRNLADDCDPTDFLMTSSDFLVLNHNEVQQLSNKNKDFICCDLTLSE